MSKLSNILGAISGKASSAIGVVKSVASSKKVKVGAIGIAITAVLVGSVYGAFELRAKSYYQGCVDGGAMGLIQLLPFAAGDIIADRGKIFANVCGELKSMTSEGKSLDDLLKEARDKSKSNSKQQQPQEDQPQEDPSN